MFFLGGFSGVLGFSLDLQLIKNNNIDNNAINNLNDKILVKSVILFSSLHKNLSPLIAYIPKFLVRLFIF